MEPNQVQASFSIPSILAVLAAIGSFATGAFWGLVLAFLAIILGLIGVVLSLSARVRGGIISALSLGAGFLGIIVAIIKAVVWLSSKG